MEMKLIEWILHTILLIGLIFYVGLIMALIFFYHAFLVFSRRGKINIKLNGETLPYREFEEDVKSTFESSGGLMIWAGIKKILIAILFWYVLDLTVSYFFS